MILLDTIGELRAVYPLADVAFVGGSIAPHGGHNVLEPGARGVCVVTGAHTHNFAAITKALLDEKALVQLPNVPPSAAAAELASALNELLTDDAHRRDMGQRALAVCNRNRGATERTVQMIAKLLDAKEIAGTSLPFPALHGHGCQMTIAYMNRAARNPIALALRPLATLYGVAMKARRALYRSGRFRAHELGAPVISVGNLTTGGTGKTPLVEWIANELAQKGRRVCILTRGYGRRRSGSRVIVSNGSEILADANQAGDEPLLLAERLKGLAAVICDADRVSAARWAVENFKSDVFVLDDGFQHLRVARNLNILTIDATNPWGNGKLLPAGILRESRSELNRADCIVITRADDPNHNCSAAAQDSNTKPWLPCLLFADEIERPATNHGRARRILDYRRGD